MGDCINAPMCYKGVESVVLVSRFSSSSLVDLVFKTEEWGENPLYVR